MDDIWKRGDYKISLCIYRIWWNPNIERIHNILIIQGIPPFSPPLCFQMCPHEKRHSHIGCILWNPNIERRIDNIGGILIIQGIPPFQPIQQSHW